MIPETSIFTQNEYHYRNYTKSDQVIAIYFHRKDTISLCSTFEIDLSAGSYSLKWVNTKTGIENNDELKDHHSGWIMINVIRKGSILTIDFKYWYII